MSCASSDEAGDAAAASAQARDDLSTDFDLLDDALDELGPTMAALEDAATETTPLLSDLRAAAPGLNTLAANLPAFARATERSLVSLGAAAKPGIQALRQGDDEIRLLAEAASNAPPVTTQLKHFLDDLADPRRAVAIDDRVDEVTGRDNPEPGQPDTRGYTGMEGLLNYFYYFGGALNQFDERGALPPLQPLRRVRRPVRIVERGAELAAGAGSGLRRRRRRPDAGPHHRPRALSPVRRFPRPEPAGHHARLGRVRPGRGPLRRRGLPGGLDRARDLPAGPARGVPGQRRAELADEPVGRRRRGRPGRRGARRPEPPALPQNPDEVRDQLEDLLDLPGKALDDLGLGGQGGQNGGGGGKNLNDALNNVTQGTNQAAQDLLDFLFAP